MNDVVKQHTVSLMLTADLLSEIGKCNQLLAYAQEAYPAIEDAATAQIASQDRQTAQLAARTLTARRDAYMGPAETIIATARADWNPAIENAEAAVRWIGQKLIEFTEAEQRRVAEERRLREVAEREARAKAEAEAAAILARAEAEAKEKARQAAEADRARREAEAQGNAEAAAAAAAVQARAISEARAAQEAGEAQAGELILAADAAVLPEPEAATVAGFGTAKNWKAELTGTEDEAVREIIEAITGLPVEEWTGQRQEFISYLCLNIQALHKSAKAHEVNFNVPGLRARNFPVGRTAGRPRKS